MAQDNYIREIDRWHAARIDRLTAPGGWLSLVGLDWLAPGRNRLGGAPDNDIVIAKAPAHLATLEWVGNAALTLTLDPASGATVDGQPVTQAVLLDDSHANPTTVAFGTVSFIVIDRGGRKALRVRDTEAATRTRFAGIERFAVDPAWRIVADWLPLDPPFQLATGTVIGTIENHVAPGKAVFRHDGQSAGLFPMLETSGDAQLFVVFADRTSGKETYGAARFLYVDMPRDGKIVLDFNKAYNPPCAFTAYATCQLAPPENRLDLRVTAGERRYVVGPP